jgi:sugar phosphate isomerase/epimerase
MKPTRRDLLTASALALAAPPSSAAAAPNLHFPTEPRDRLSVASYSFRDSIDGPRARVPEGSRIALQDFPALMVQRFDVHNVELLGQHFKTTGAAYLRELRDAVKAAGSHIVNIPTSVGASLYDPDPAQRAIAIDNAKKWIDIAVAVECPSIRVHIQKVDGAKPDVNLAARSLAPIAAYGMSKGVVVNLENDNLISEDAFFIANVIDKMKDRWLRALPDFCNSMLKGTEAIKDEKFNYDAVAAMFQRAYNICHVKDSEIENGKVIRVDLARTFAIARQNRYRGYFSIEWEGAGEAWEETGKLIQQSLKYLG